ncbi:hypothetical protein BHM03_00037403 [Ensete ventricosum]|nr:hypothetical protein BHM03_00037403 [Ensete ventricosum]
MLLPSRQHVPSSSAQCRHRNNHRRCPLALGGIATNNNHCRCLSYILPLSSPSPLPSSTSGAHHHSPSSLTPPLTSPLLCPTSYFSLPSLFQHLSSIDVKASARRSLPSTYASPHPRLPQPAGKTILPLPCSSPSPLLSFSLPPLCFRWRRSCCPSFAIAAALCLRRRLQPSHPLF